MIACASLGALAAVAFSTFAGGQLVQTLMLAWVVSAASFCLWTWAVVARFDEHETAEFAVQEDESIVVTDIALLVGTLASLVGVGFLLSAGATKDGKGVLEAALGASSVVASWFLVHVVFVLRYARTYYGDSPGARGIEFEGGEPDYWDFAYVAFDLGMTYQISDTNLKNRLMRRLVLKHTLLSYLLGVGVIATTINLVTSLVQG